MSKDSGEPKRSTERLKYFAAPREEYNAALQMDDESDADRW
jgi:hypothetical protein